MTTLNRNAALVILSGGQDSTTCLYWALEHFADVHAISFNYGQRHIVELESAVLVATMARVVSHEIIDLSDKVLISTSPLVNDQYDVGSYKDVASLPGGVEPTFVPSRNMLFLTVASNRAYALRTQGIVIGVSEEDYGGYFDCRGDFIESMETAINLAVLGPVQPMQPRFHVHTPLISLDKKATVELAMTMPGCMEALAFSHTCYKGKTPPCGTCHACLLRAKGFEQAGVDDPLVERVAKGK
jgi:7-cyano-7-deazaguanine synthase